MRYLIVGGLAVVAYGHLRFTADVDLFVDLEHDNVRRALEALRTLGYRPRPPVAMQEFADPAVRQRWAREKGVMVFSLQSPEHDATEVHLFVEPPFEFAAEHARATRVEIAPGLEGTFISLPGLVAMKESIGRQVDEEDARPLKEIQELGCDT